MKRLAIILIALALGAAGAFAQSVGGMSGLGIVVSKSSGGGGGGGGCTMNGIFDLTNTCNDIYFIGALK